MDKKSLLAQLKEKIAQAESRGNYNAYNTGKAIPKSGNLTELTLEELMRKQSLKPGDKDRIFAAGKYQVIPDTMKQAVAKLKLDKKQKFSPEMQEIIFDYLVEHKRPEIARFIKTGLDPISAARAFSHEWASIGSPEDTVRKTKSGNIPIKRGESYYSGIGGNKAKIKPEEIEALLSQYKALSKPSEPIPMEAPKVDPIAQERDAAFEKMIQQPQVPLIAQSEQGFADGGYKETEDFLKNMGIAAGAQNSNVFPYRPEEQEVPVEAADDVAQTRETGAVEETKPSSIELPIRDPFQRQEDPQEDLTEQDTIPETLEPESKEQSTNTMEGYLAKLKRLKAEESQENDKEYKDKENKAKWGDIFNTAFSGLDKAFAHYGAANPNAILKPVQLDYEKSNKLENLLKEKSASLKAKEKVVEDIMSPQKLGDDLVTFDPESDKFNTLYSGKKDDKPKTFKIGNELVEVDPVTGKVTPIYKGEGEATSYQKETLDLKRQQLEDRKNHQQAMISLRQEDLKSKSSLSSDPNSPESKAERNFFRSQGIDVPEETTQAMLARYGKGVISRDTTQDVQGKIDDRFRASMDHKKVKEKTDRLDKVIDKFNKDANVEKSNTMLSQTNIVSEVLNSDNPIGDSSIPTFMSRASGEVGALTEADKAPFGGSKAITARLAQIASDYASGRLTDSNREYLKDLVNIYKKAAQKNIASRAVLMSDQKGFGEVSAEELLGRMFGRDFTSEEIRAIKWANSNKNDPKAEAIFQKVLFRGR
jgi:hypothetical protein